jgi:hypothetical protein
VAGNRRGGDGLDASAAVGGSCVASRDAPNRGMWPSTSGQPWERTWEPSTDRVGRILVRSLPPVKRRAPNGGTPGATTCKHLATATTMYRETNMRFWLEQAEMEVKEVG